MAKPSLQGLLTATQFVMNSWEKDAFRSRQRAELGVDTKRKGLSTSTIPPSALAPMLHPSPTK